MRGEDVEKLESILFIVDRNDARTHALRKAAALARRVDASLELFLCDAEHAYALKREYDPRGVDVAKDNCLDECYRYLEGLRKHPQLQGLHVSVDAMLESPLYEGIVRKVQQSRPDLVFRGLRSAGTAAPVGLSAADWGLARTCPVPLLLARERPWRDQPRIAAAVDVSKEETPSLTHTILRAADMVRRHSAGCLDVLHAARNGASPFALEADRKRLSRVAEEAGVVPQAVHVLAGEPEKRLCEFATGRRSDVMVLGALTHRQAPAAHVGTLTGTLIESLDCDVLLVKPPGFVCPVSYEEAPRAVRFA